MIKWHKAEVAESCLPAGRGIRDSLNLNKVYYVYVIRSLKAKKFYKGFTVDLDRRIDEHNLGRCGSTKNDRPWELIYVHICYNRQEARDWEKFFKSGVGREIIAEVAEWYTR